MNTAFLDLNLRPCPPPPPAPAAAAAAAAEPLLNQEIEPKPEPIDDSPFPHSFPFYQSPPDPFPKPSSNPGVPELLEPQVSAGNPDYALAEPDSLAIVSAEETPSNCPSLPPAPPPGPLAVVKPHRQNKRFAELVRVTDLRAEDDMYFRNEVRRKRLTFNALRILYAATREISGKGFRGDLFAASVMRTRGLWTNRGRRIVGSIPGIYIGDVFLYRMELMVLGLHGQTQAGIDYLPASMSSNGEPIATSVIISGGYEDDEDCGDVIIYTGHGGKDKLNRQCMHQKLEGGNLALERSMRYGIEIRVIRGIKWEGLTTTTHKVYVYDGLYRIVESWFDTGKSGFNVLKYKMARIEGQPEMGSLMMRFARSISVNPLSARPSGYSSLDISQKKENVPVYLFNDIDNDNEPLNYEYLTSSIFPPLVLYGSGNGIGCECVFSCTNDCFCYTKNGGEPVYDQNGILMKGKPLIFECGPFCKCPPTCHNRITQRGLKHRLEVFRSKKTGWGVRSLELIPAGSFICEYSGVVLTREQADIFSLSNDPLIYPGRFTAKWEEWGNLNHVFPECVSSQPPLVPPLDFAMDVSKMRNVACYISQSSVPNVFVQQVLYDHNNVSFPHLMLFALDNIPPLGELSLNYGVADEWAGKPILLTG